MMTLRNKRQKQAMALLCVGLPAALGLLFCLLNAAGAKLLCLSSGCEIYAGYAIGGLSIDLLGAGAFAIILAGTLAIRRHPFLRHGLYLVLLAGLLIDSLFLGWQILFWPCVRCLAVALLLLLCVLGARRAFPEFRTLACRLVLLVWAIAFIPVAVSAAKELFLQPWPMLGPADARIQVFFSPTCPACATTVSEILEKGELRDQTAFFPIAKNDEDLLRLARIKDQSDDRDLMDLFLPDRGEGGKADFSLQLRLARNKMVLARLGVDSVPLVISPQLVFEDRSFSPVSPQSTIPNPLYWTPPIDDGCSISSPTEEACE